MSELDPNAESQKSRVGGGIIAGWLVAFVMALLISGIGSILFVDRNPSYQIDQVFLYSWASLCFILPALFAVVHGFRTRSLKNGLVLAVVFLLPGILIGVLGALLSRTAPWVWVPLLLAAILGIPKLIRRTLENSAARREPPNPAAQADG
jgi:glucan phosphoethanolaminetransferase (alkaline phosphatase superfamily)